MEPRHPRTATGQHRRPRGAAPRPFLLAAGEPPPAPHGDRDFRPDIQGLRALAVGLVVAYHLYPSVVPGGFVGVDVFFVISGYLITGHLMRGYLRSGRVRLLDFYGRRARRLLPAAALVLVVTWFAAEKMLPATRLGAAAEQVRASALYFQNWVLAHNAVDYLTAGDAPSPVQHFWSLSVEEQFYLVWPLVFVIAAVVGWRWGVRRGRGAAFLLAGGIVLASLATSIRLTATDPAAAYFVTTTRMWELGLGGLLVLAPRAWTARLAGHGWLAWAGLGAILASAFALDGTSPFPGSIALLPVVGAAAVLHCGSTRGRFGPARLTSSRPFVFVGDISYSLYLWHWPIIVLWKSYSGGGIGVLDGPAIAATSVLLAWATKVLVEDRVRLAPIVTRRTWRSLATATTVLIPVLAAMTYVAPKPYHGTADVTHPGAAVLAEHPTSLPPSATASPRKAGIRPPLVDAAHDQPSYGACEANMTRTRSKPCYFGATRNPTRTVALVGDSVAAEWFDSMVSLANKYHWKLVTYLRQLCTWSATMTTKGGTNAPYDSCHQWGASATKDMLKLHPDVVITSSRPSLGTPDAPTPGPRSWREIARGAVTYWRRVAAAGIKVVALAESPEMGRNIPDCLTSRHGSARRCSVPTSRAVAPGTPMKQAAAMAGPAAELVDLNPLICTRTICPPIIGSICVYRDDHHLTRTYTTSLTPFLDRRLLATEALRPLPAASSTAPVPAGATGGPGK